MKLKLREQIVLCVFFLAGFGFLLYPAVSNWYNSYHFVQETKSYEANIGNLTDEEIAQKWDEARVYNDNLKGTPLHDPFMPGSGMALPENYRECLNVDGVMGYVEIPKIDVKLPIYHGTSDAVLKKGIGHIESSALPTGDSGGNPILTGHTGLPEAKLFTDLTKLALGDRFYLDVLDTVFCYQVDQIKVILPEELSDLVAYKDYDYVTLLTCTPYGVNTHRLLVRGVRIPYDEAVQAADQQGPSWGKILIVIGCVTVLLILGLWNRRRCRKARELTEDRDGNHRKENKLEETQ